VTTVTKLKRVVDMRAGGTPSVDDPLMWDDEGLPWVAIADMTKGPTVTRTDRRVSQAGVVAKSLPVGNQGTLLFAMYASVGAVSTLGTRGSWNQAILGIHPRLELADSRFARYWLEHLKPSLSALFRSNTQDNLNAEQVGNLPFPVLAVSRQSAIADFLDRETSRIDALIAAKGRLVRLLIEAEQRLLIDQVGDWRTTNVWSLRQAGTEVVTGPFGTQLNAGEYVDDGVPVINPTHITRKGDITHDRRVSVSVDAAERLRRHRVTSGDILLGRKGDVGRSAIVGVEQAGWVCGSDAIAVRTNTASLDARFLAILLQIDLYRQQLYARSTGAMVASVNEDTLLDFRVPRLPLARQGVLVNRMNRVMLNRRTAIDRISASQILLEERRQAMVSAAVTGQLDILEEA
jgi:type I restriction enzyme S subunit